jgi:hypothetical protein
MHSPIRPLTEARHWLWVWYMQWRCPSILEHHASACAGVVRIINPVVNAIEVIPKINLRIRPLLFSIAQ